MSSHDEPADPDPATTIDLQAIADAAPPFATLYLGPGAQVRARAQIAIDRPPVPAPHSGLIMASVVDDEARSQAIVVDGRGHVTALVLDDPLAYDVARYGDCPSLGPLVEIDEMTASHVVVTVEDDAFGITSFGTDTRLMAEDTPAVFESVDQLVDQLLGFDPDMVALIGAQAEIDNTVSHLQTRLGDIALNSYPSDDIDADLMAIADEIVRDAATLAAERLTHDLAHFRQARSAGLTVEGTSVLSAISSGAVSRLLVHDDATDGPESSEIRIVDRVIAAALVDGVPITMIPAVPEDRGPVDGIGAILRDAGAANAVASAIADPSATAGAAAQRRPNVVSPG